jgi:hypothetical protein
MSSQPVGVWIAGLAAENRFAAAFGTGSPFSQAAC